MAKGPSTPDQVGEVWRILRTAALSHNAWEFPDIPCMHVTGAEGEHGLPGTTAKYGLGTPSQFFEDESKHPPANLRNDVE
jgi:hypothetical protein